MLLSNLSEKCNCDQRFVSQNNYIKYLPIYLTFLKSIQTERTRFLKSWYVTCPSESVYIHENTWEPN